MINLIDTRHGTANQHSYSNGNCLPYTGVPFGMNFFAPQTANTHGSWWFHPEDRTFQGFRLTHQPSPWMGDFSSLLMLPIIGTPNSNELFHLQSSYRPEEAIFSPHHLKIKSLRYQITSELTPSTYGAHLLIQYPTLKDAGLVIKADGPSKWQLSENGKTLTGYISNASGCEDPELKMYVAYHFSQPVHHWQDLHNNLEPIKGNTWQGQDPTLHLSFDLGEPTLSITMATSFISEQQVHLNLSRELPLSFKDALNQGKEAWEHYLSKITVTDKDAQKVQLFYQMMYRCFLFPQKWYELDQQEKPIHYDTLSRKVTSGFYYTNNGFWDTYKTVYPLYSLIAQEEYGEMLEGFLNAYRHAGYLPKWLSPDERGLMPGTLIDAVIADAAMKDIRLDLMPEFLEAMLKSATTQSENDRYGRQGTLDYLTYGYVPSDYHESVNHTQDYAYSDFCIAQVAQILGKTEIANSYWQQSLNYRQLVDPTTGLMRPKDRQGQWIEPFNPISWGRHYAEGSSYQNSYAVFHDMNGLINSHGGAQNFLSHITELCNTEPLFDVSGYGFEIHEMSEMAAIDFGQVAISNQPSFHLPYLFHYVKQPWTSQHLLKELMSRAFHLGFAGYPGDEDNGSMSAWYLFNSLGFYPVTPGSGEYTLGIPLFDEVTIQLSSGKSLHIQTNHNAPQYHYVTSLQINDQPYTGLAIPHHLLMAGGNLTFNLGLVPPCKTISSEDLPYSLTSETIF